MSTRPRVRARLRATPRLFFYSSPSSSCCRRSLRHHPAPARTHARTHTAQVFYGARAVDTFEKHHATVVKHYEKLEGFFRVNGFVFSAANRPTTGDFHLFEMIDQHEEFARAFGQPSIITHYPLLNAFYGRFYTLPTLQVWCGAGAGGGVCPPTHPAGRSTPGTHPTLQLPASGSQCLPSRPTTQRSKSPRVALHPRLRLTHKPAVVTPPQ
jgi:hypothetical protein